jgi:hypothetical protein
MTAPYAMFTSPAAGGMAPSKLQVYNYTTTLDTYQTVAEIVIGYSVAHEVASVVMTNDLLMKVEYTRDNLVWYTVIEDFPIPKATSTQFVADFIAYNIRISVKPAVAGQHGTAVITYIGSGMNLPPSMTYAFGYEALTVTNAVAVTLDRSIYDASRQAVITIEDNPIRCRWDGTAATTTEGHLLQPGDTVILQFTTDIYHFSAIATGVDAKIKVTYSR